MSKQVQFKTVWNVFCTEPNATEQKCNGRLFQEEGPIHEKAWWAWVEVQNRSTCISSWLVECCDRQPGWLEAETQHLMYAGTKPACEACTSRMIFKEIHLATGSQRSIFCIYCNICECCSLLAAARVAQFRMDWSWCKWNPGRHARTKLWLSRQSKMNKCIRVTAALSDMLYDSYLM